jgi:hypothetical protein
VRRIQRAKEERKEWTDTLSTFSSSSLVLMNETAAEKQGSKVGIL